MELVGNHFYFIRHGETAWNALRLCQGQRDVPLSERGRASTVALAQKLAEFSFECICTSPLERARHTAELIQQYQQSARIYLVKELMERNWGELEGIGSEKMYEIEKNEESERNFIPGFAIEDRNAFKNRIVQGLNIAFTYHSSPLIISHGRLFLSLCEILNMPLVRQVDNLVLLELKNDEGRWSCTTVNLKRL